VEKLIRNSWRLEPGRPFAISRILSHEMHPEGLDVARIRFNEAGEFAPMRGAAHIISVLRGGGFLRVAGEAGSRLRLEANVHLYLPPNLESVVHAEPATELLSVSSASTSQARGKQLILRDERFLAACASGSQSLRWVLTPQYLSRRIFLHHDAVLLSKSGNPVSWFRTTMFDVTGLPTNEDREPVFKMSYNSRTEFNVCYDVQGAARVRMARHPYRRAGQIWESWLPLDSDSTYHLNEAAGGPEEERDIDKTTGTPYCLRNKHEVHIVNGHVTLFCLFDPAPTGVERHRPGEYSDYEPLSQVLGTGAYAAYRREIAAYDAMVDQLSLAEATNASNSFHGAALWELYERGREAQAVIEGALVRSLAAEGNGRERVIAPWTQGEKGRG